MTNNIFIQVYNNWNKPIRGLFTSEMDAIRSITKSHCLQNDCEVLAKFAPLRESGWKLKKVRVEIIEELGETGRAYLDTRIADLKLTGRLRRGLECMRIKTIGDVLQYSVEDLMKRNKAWGKVTKRQLTDFLEEIKLPPQYDVPSFNSLEVHPITHDEVEVIDVEGNVFRAYPTFYTSKRIQSVVKRIGEVSQTTWDGGWLVSTDLELTPKEVKGWRKIVE